ncbi:MAG: ribonucleotide reductase, beta subunit [Candidatus Nanosalina sp. J07AB43]|nr:MAG: ribonucleotide reductase, beta subunit [Candidatus Nanosalina sp. J07AB43]
MSTTYNNQTETETNTGIEAEADQELQQEVDIFEPRENLKPYEYPEFMEFKEAIRNSYWEEKEFNFQGDVQDFRENTTDVERSVIKKTMLAIAQIEVKVKTFWGDVYKQLPKPEIGDVGSTFSESEVRHKDAYAKLLEVLGLEDEFKELSDVPAIQRRIDYMDDCLAGADSADEKEYAQSILLFSTFVEHVSLFSQFLIMTSFDKEDKRFKGIANAVEATSKEEQVHGLFGQELVETIREENPDMFGDGFEQDVKEACEKAYEAEMDILDWIFSEGELDFLPREHIDEFMKGRFNETLGNVGVDPVFETDDDLLDETRWFDEDIMMTKDNDFFSKRSTTYSKGTTSVTPDDMF